MTIFVGIKNEDDDTGGNDEYKNCKALIHGVTLSLARQYQEINLAKMTSIKLK